MQKKIVKSSMLFILFTVIAKILGFFREQLVALRFGTSYEADIGVLCQGIVMLLFATIGDAVATTFIPILTNYIHNKNKEEREKFVNNILNIIMLFSIILTLIGIIFSKYITFLFAPGFRNNVDVFKTTINIMKIMFISFIFMAIQSVLKGVLETHGEYVTSQKSELLSNIVIILFLMIFAPKYGLYGFAFATVFAYFIKLIVTIPKFKKLGYRYKFFITFNDKNIKSMLILMIPVIIGTSAQQVNSLIDRIIATTLGEGALSILSYANRLSLFIFTIFSLVITTIVYPILSEKIVNKKIEEFKITIINSIKIILSIMIPSTVGIIVLSTPIVRIIFQRGEFDSNSVKFTAMALIFYAPAIIAYGIRDVVNRAFYSLNDTKTPMKNVLVGIVINILLNLILSVIMGINGLALATTISSIITSIILLNSLRIKLGEFKIREIYEYIIKTLSAAIVMGIVVYLCNNIGELYIAKKFESISIIISIIVGVIIYIVLMVILNKKDMEDMKKIILKSN